MKTRGFSLHILAPFLAIDDIVFTPDTFSFYLSEQIDKDEIRTFQMLNFFWLFKQAFTAWLQLRRSDKRSPALTH